MAPPETARPATSRPSPVRTSSYARRPADVDLPDIAVVIPSYNYEEFVGDAVDSVLTQTRPYSQVVVVDDGSTDSSLEVLARYGDRVEVVAKENSGLLGACLAGLERVRAPYVHFLDADDLAGPQLVERCATLLVDEPVKLQFQLEGVDADGSPNGSVFPSFAPGYDSADMREDNRVGGFYQCPPTSGNIFHTETLRGLGLESADPTLPLDGAGCAVMPYLGEVVSVSEPLGCYRVHGSSMSNAQLLPTPEQCTREIADFEANWEVAARVMGHDAPPYGDSTPLFVLEREHVRDALTGGQPSAVRLGRYLTRLTSTRQPAWQRAVQGVWMTTLLVPSRNLRAQLVHMRRSGSARPAWIRRLIALARG